MESEFLTESTQKLRKSLLIASFIGYAIAEAGLVVAKVSLLGSELSITRFEVIPSVLGYVVLYFLVTFVVFGLWDYSQAYRKRRLDIVELLSKGTVATKQEAEEAIGKLEQELELLGPRALRTYMRKSEEEEAERRNRTQELREKVTVLKRISNFFDGYRGSMLERGRSRKVLRFFKTAFDLYVPIIIGLYVVILLFSTKIPEIRDTTTNLGNEVITSETVDANDQLPVGQIE